MSWDLVPRRLGPSGSKDHRKDLSRPQGFLTMMARFWLARDLTTAVRACEKLRKKCPAKLLILR